MKPFLFVGAVVLALLSSGAWAGEPRLVESYGDWDAYVFDENGSKVCYMASKPQKSAGDYSHREEVHALVTHRRGENTKDVFSYIAGYSYKPGSDARVEVDAQKFPLFTQDNMAWTPGAESDEKLALAIRSGSSMIVHGMSARGTATIDTFSLKGSAAAHDRISKDCGY